MSKKIFDSWISLVQVPGADVFTVDMDAIPPEGRGPMYEYMHYRANHSSEHPDAIRAAQEFEAATGYSAADFMNYFNRVRHGA